MEGPEIAVALCVIRKASVAGVEGEMGGGIADDVKEVMGDAGSCRTSKVIVEPLGFLLGEMRGYWRDLSQAGSDIIQFVFQKAQSHWY